MSYVSKRFRTFRRPITRRYLVGEKGPEMILPIGTAGTVTLRRELWLMTNAATTSRRKTPPT